MANRSPDSRNLMPQFGSSPLYHNDADVSGFFFLQHPSTPPTWLCTVCIRTGGNTTTLKTRHYRCNHKHANENEEIWSLHQTLCRPVHTSIENPRRDWALVYPFVFHASSTMLPSQHYHRDQAYSDASSTESSKKKVYYHHKYPTNIEPIQQ